MEAAGVSGPDTLPRELTLPNVGDHAAHRGGSGGPRPRASFKGPSISLPGPYPETDGSQEQTPSPQPTGVSQALGCTGALWGGNARRTGHGQRWAPRARPPGRPRPSPPFLRGIIGRLRRAQARASCSPRPRRRVPFPRAAEGRLPTSRPRPPQLRRLRVAPWASPGSAYLALDLLHHFGGWGLTSNRKHR